MKLKIRIGIIGYLPFHFDKKLIKKWKSNEFEIVDDIQEQDFMENADIPPEKFNVMGSGRKLHYSSGYSDDLLEKETNSVERDSKEANFSIWITFVPLEDNYFVRRLSSNRVILSYFEMYDILKKELIPVENLLLRTIYRHILIFYKYKSSIPSHKQLPLIPFIHDDTRGCLFDMCANKSDIIFYLNKPDICKHCDTGLIGNDNNLERVGGHHIKNIKNECLNKIKKGSYYKIVAFVKENPVRSLILSALFGIIVDTISTLIYNFLFK